MALSGRKITTMQTNGVEEDISLRLASVNQISDLHKIYFQNGEGQFIPFEDIASLKLTSGVSESIEGIVAEQRGGCPFS